MKVNSCLFSTYINTVNGIEYGLFGPYCNFQSYLANKFYYLVIIKQPMPGESTISTCAEIYVNKELVKIVNFSSAINFIFSDHFGNLSSYKTSIRLKVRDFISTIFFAVKLKGDAPYTAMIGLESINTLAGYVLKKMGLVNNLVYFANDWHPKRYGAMMNHIFLWLDRFCSYHADRLWLMNMNIHKSRVSIGYKNSLINKTDSIHGGLPFFSEDYKGISERQKHSIVYASRNAGQGMDLALSVFSQVRKQFRNAIMYITGNCDKEDFSNYDVEGVVFTGFLTESELNKLISQSWVGLAVWRSDIASSATYGDPEKIRRYLNYGIPIVVTRNAYTSLIVEDAAAGIVCDSNYEDLISAILLLFSDANLYYNYSENSLKIGKKYKSINRIDKAINSIGIKDAER